MGKKSTQSDPYHDSTIERRQIMCRIYEKDAKMLLDDIGAGFYGINQFIGGWMYFKLINKLKELGITEYSPDNVTRIRNLIESMRFDGDGRSVAISTGRTRASNGRTSARGVRAKDARVVGKSADSKSGIEQGRSSAEQPSEEAKENNEGESGEVVS